MEPILYFLALVYAVVFILFVPWLFRALNHPWDTNPWVVGLNAVASVFMAALWPIWGPFAILVWTVGKTVMIVREIRD